MGSAVKDKTAAARCARCGACTAVCPVYRASGGREAYSGRGKKHLLDVMGEGTPSPVFEDIFSKCLLCGACVSACPRDIDIPAEVRRARSHFSTFYGEHGYTKFLARKVLEHPELLGIVRTFGYSIASLLEKRLPRESGLRLQLALFDRTEETRSNESTVKPQSSNEMLEPLLYFPGCSATQLYPETLGACTALCKIVGYELIVPEGFGCCGLAISASGDSATAVRLAKKNIALMESVKGPILVSCGSCYSHLHRYGELFEDDAEWRHRGEAVAGRLVEISRFLDQELPETIEVKPDSEPIRVFYQDPCHLRHGTTLTREPRSLLQRFNGIELLELPDGPQCCGHGGLFHLGAPELSAHIRDRLADQVLSMSPDIITSSCSGCLMQWRMAIKATGKRLPVLHLAELLVRFTP